MIYITFCYKCMYAIATKNLKHAKMFMVSHFDKCHNGDIDLSKYGYFEYKNIKSTNLILSIRQKRGTILDDDTTLKIINDTIRLNQKRIKQIYGKAYLPITINIQNYIF